MGSRTCLHFKSAKRFCLGENAKEKDDLNLNLVRHQIQGGGLFTRGLRGGGEPPNGLHQIRKNPIQFIRNNSQNPPGLKSQTKPLLPKQMKNSISQKFQIIILGGLFFRAGENRGWNLIVRKREPARRAQLISA